MIKITNIGHDSKHKTKFHMIRKSGVSNHILLLVKSEAYFELDGVKTTTAPNMAILFDKNTYMHYGSIENNFNDDWIHFDFVNEASLLDTLNIPFHTPIYLPQINSLSNYVRLLVQESHADSLHKEEIQDSLMRTLLYSLDAQILQLPKTSSYNKYYQTMNHLKINIQNTPHKKWTVDSMAEFVHLSPSYFQHLYKEMFHISCMQEVILARIERAKFYLTTTDMSIRSLSDFCGYESDLHFVRQFKTKEGLTPSQYRDLFTPL
ncbi:MAG: helix-turn-helix transcriptional regulator [Anaerocolumna sp.]